MARSIPKVREGSLLQHIEEDTTTDTISIGTAAWYSWLEQHHSFTFETPRTTFTARKEQRPGGWYWYAYRCMRGKLHSTYLGKSADLTLERLKSTADVFEQAGEALVDMTPQLKRVSSDQSVQVQPTSTLTFPTTSAAAVQHKEPEPVPTHLCWLHLISSEKNTSFPLQLSCHVTPEIHMKSREGEYPCSCNQKLLCPKASICLACSK